jgi:hypothetical protein
VNYNDVVSSNSTFVLMLVLSRLCCTEIMRKDNIPVTVRRLKCLKLLGLLKSAVLVAF